MNKEGVIIFLNSEQDSQGSSSHFTNSIPEINLTQSTEVALTEIFLPEEYYPKLAKVFVFLRIQGDKKKPYLTVKLGYYRTTQDLADHLNTQIHEVVKMRGDIDTISHLFFGVSKDGCLTATPKKQTITNVPIEEQWLGILDSTATTEFADLTDFGVDDIEFLFNFNPYREVEATKPPKVILSPLLGIKTDILDEKFLRLIPAGEKQVILEDMVYHPVKPGRYTGINIRVVGPRTHLPINFKKVQVLLCYT